MALLHKFSTARKPSEDVPRADEVEGIDAFVSEDALADPGIARGVAGPEGPHAGDSSPRAGRGRSAAMWAGVVLLAAGAGAGAWTYRQTPPAAQPASLTLQTTPPGLQVSIAGKPSGTTPVTVSLPAGEYPVELAAADGRRRTFAVSLTAGGSVVQQIELAPLAAAPELTSTLHVQTEPSRLMVSVDGVEKGFSPISIPALAAGEHQVTVRTTTGTLRRAVSVEPGKPLSLLIAGEASTLRAGWVTFASAVPLELRENGKIVGTTDADRLMLPAGEHEIEMTNEPLGFRATRRVVILPDRAVSVPVELPQGTLSINALPWAEVWLDGERIGETPIANLSRPIGSHDVLLRHPQLGERKARVTVSLKQTARLGVDMRTP